MKFSENNYFRKRATRTNLVAVVTVAFVLFILGLVGFLALRGQALTNYIKENIEIQVFLKESASQAEIDAFTSSVSKDNMVNKWRFVSKKEAAEILSKDLGTNQLEILEGYNPLQASVNISLKSIYAEKDSVDKFKAMLQSKAIVDEVAFNEVELELINKNM